MGRSKGEKSLRKSTSKADCKEEFGKLDEGVRDIIQ
jgi:hypothetical protein